MLKRILISELVVGMYIHELIGVGIENTLWRDGFLLQSEHDLKRIQNSQILELWINLCKGIDVIAEYEQLSFFSPNLARSFGGGGESVSVVTLSQEILVAIDICARSKEAVSSMFSDLRMGRVVETNQVSGLVAEISDSIMRHPNAFISLVRLKTSDEYTYMHSVAVCALMVALARQMGLSEEFVYEAGVAGLMHDVGKSAIPVSILNKPGKLCEGEFETKRGHPEAGAHMLAGNSLFSPNVLDVCLHHHERYDGTGYPHKLAGSDISQFARMGAICDVYDAVTSNRPYKKAWGAAESIRRMANWAGHFDEKIFQAFVKCVGIYPVGSLVKLKSERLAVVMRQSESSLLNPRVKVFYCTRARKRISECVIDLEAHVGVDRIIGLECPEDWGIEGVDELWLGIRLSEV